MGFLEIYFLNTVSGLMERRRFISDCVTIAAEELGYPMEQLDVAIAFVEGRDVFAILPTGFGKSLCYACLPASFDRMLEQDQGDSIVVLVTSVIRQDVRARSDPTFDQGYSKVVV